MLRRFSINFAIFSMLLDALLVFISMVSMSYVRIQLNQWSFIAYLPADIKYPLVLYFLFPVVWVAVLAGFSIYDGKKFFRAIDEFSVLTAASFIAAIVQAGILYLTYRDFSRALFILIILVSFLLCTLWRVIARVVFRVRKETLTVNRNLLILGAGDALKRVNERLAKDPTEIIENITLMDLGASAEFKSGSPDQCPEITAAIRTAVSEQRITDVIICFPRNSATWIEGITAGLEDLPLGVWVGLDFFDIAMSDTRVEMMADLPLLDLRAPAMDEYSRIIKRGFDLVLCSIAILLSSPVLILVSLLVLVFDGWPVFFLQDRVGENGRHFKIIKFRTMVRDAEKMRSQVEQVDEKGNIIHKTASDPRITRLGRFLRRFSLDELPQFFNVIKGEMSLVGPRPELPYLVENYEHWQRRRLSVPPGITGWWQINGRSERVMHLHTEDDLYYIENFSIWLDIKILIRTVWTVIIGKGSF